MECKSYLAGLIINCPFDDVKSGCKIEKYRKSDLLEKARICKEIPVWEMIELINSHKNCIVQRKRELVAATV